MRRCTVCDSYQSNPRCPACQPRIAEDTITEDSVMTLAEEIDDIHAEITELVEDIRCSDISPAEAADTLAEIVSTIVRLGELYSTPTKQ